jgi:hypothetical protein
MHFHRSYAIGFLTSTVVGAALLSGPSAVAGPLWTFNAAMCVPMDVTAAALKPQILSEAGGQLVQNVPNTFVNMLCPLPYETVGGIPQVQGRKPTMNGWVNNGGVDFFVCRTNQGGGGGECGGNQSPGFNGNYSLTLSDTTAWSNMTPGDALYVEAILFPPDSNGSDDSLFSYWY